MDKHSELDDSIGTSYSSKEIVLCPKKDTRNSTISIDTNLNYILSNNLNYSPKTALSTLL